MTCDLYLINPAEGSPAYYGLEVFEAWGAPRMARLADLSTPTVAAFAPADWIVRLCDERVQPVDFDIDARFVGITGKVSQRARMKELAAQFRRRGRTVLMGGPHVSLSPEDMRGHANILVRGEIEAIAEKLFADLENGTWRNEYVGDKPDLASTPVPRWDLYERGMAASAQVQTSRGCPFECEFCDVIQYLGRKQRWKAPDRVTAELDLLHAQGYRAAFFADDNLTVVRKRARALVDALVEWNGRGGRQPMTFGTQISIDAAREPELLAQMRRAGFDHVFIGIETVNEASLAETGKRQNLRIDQVAEVGKVVDAGLMVIGGMIVGFDSDGPDIFEMQDAFIDRMPTPLMNPGLLVASDATPLHARMKAEGRLLSSDHAGGAGVATTNIVPLRMSMDEMTGGMAWLLNRVFDPGRFAVRLRRFVERVGGARAAPVPPASPSAPFFSGYTAPLARQLAGRGDGERALLQVFQESVAQRPDLRRVLAAVFVQYCQARHMLEYEGLWDGGLARFDRPPSRRTRVAA